MGHPYEAYTQEQLLITMQENAEEYSYHTSIADGAEACFNDAKAIMQSKFGRTYSMQFGEVTEDK